MTKRQRSTFTSEFKEQIVKLYESGKSKNDIIKEYDLTTTAFNSWIKRGQTTGFLSERAIDLQRKRIIKVKKENQQLRMENDILKQAALIL